MKKKKFPRKLSLNKTTISTLTSVEMAQHNAGDAATGGCTDGTLCSMAGACTEWNCTRTQCTADPCGIKTYTCQPQTEIG